MADRRGRLMGAQQPGRSSPTLEMVASDRLRHRRAGRSRSRQSSTVGHPRHRATWAHDAHRGDAVPAADAADQTG